MERHAGQPIAKLLETYSREVAAVKDVLLKPTEDEAPLAPEDLPADEDLLRFLNTDPPSTAFTASYAAQVRRSRAHWKSWAAVSEKARRGERLPQELAFQARLQISTWERNCSSPTFVLVKVGDAATNASTGEVDIEVSHEELVEYVIWASMRVWLQIEQKQRATGNFCLCHLIVDCAELSLTQLASQHQLLQACKEAAHITQDLTPCMNVKIVVMHVGWAWRMIFEVVQKFMPARSVAKTRACGASDAKTEDPATCPYLTSLGLGKKDLPECLGGACPMSKGGDQRFFGREAEQKATSVISLEDFLGPAMSD